MPPDQNHSTLAIFVSEALACAGIPGGTILSELLNNKLRERHDNAQKILLKQIRQGNLKFDEADIDPFIEMTLRFIKAVDEGAAMPNVSLLSKVIIGLKKTQNFKADEFNRWASILSHMTEHEIFAVGTAFTVSKTTTQKEDGSGDNFWNNYQKEMQKCGFTNAQIVPLCASISRFGLLIPVSAWGGIMYEPSEWLFDLGNIANILDR